MPEGPEFVAIGGSVMTPLVVIRPMRALLTVSVNQSAPSGPAAILYGAPGFGSGNSVMVTPGPFLTSRAILLAPRSQNHIAPSGPRAIPRGSELVPAGMA